MGSRKQCTACRPESEAKFWLPALVQGLLSTVPILGWIRAGPRTRAGARSGQAGLPTHVHWSCCRIPGRLGPVRKALVTSFWLYAVFQPRKYLLISQQQLHPIACTAFPIGQGCAQAVQILCFGRSFCSFRQLLARLHTVAVIICMRCSIRPCHQVYSVAACVALNSRSGSNC